MPLEIELITPDLVRDTIQEAFPGAEIEHRETLSSTHSYSFAFGEFSLSVFVPFGERAQTKVSFQRAIREPWKVIYFDGATFQPEEVDEFIAFIKKSKGYVLGIYVALHQVLFEALPSPPPEKDIFGDYLLES